MSTVCLGSAGCGLLDLLALAETHMPETHMPERVLEFGDVKVTIPRSSARAWRELVGPLVKNRLGLNREIDLSVA